MTRLKGGRSGVTGVGDAAESAGRQAEALSKVMGGVKYCEKFDNLGGTLLPIHNFVVARLETSLFICIATHAHRNTPRHEACTHAK